MLRRGDLVPHFDVTTLEGEAVTYSTIWQRRNLVLVTLPATDPDGTFRNYADQIRAHFTAETDTACVITREPAIGIPQPAVVVADRWGEIIYMATGAQAAEFPRPCELVEWVSYVRHQCPECEGEAR